jgi:chromosome segregation ATPase
MKLKSEKENRMHTAEMDKLGELQTKRDALRAHREALERQKAQLNSTLEEIAGRRPALTKEHAKGDPYASKRLDDLDFEERSIRRSLAGVDGCLAENAAEIQPLDAELARESAIAAAEERRKQFEASTQRAQARRKKVEALEQELTCELTGLHEDLVDLTAIFPDLGGSNVATKIYDDMFFHLKRVNAGWRFSPKVFGNRHVLEVQPMLPPKR